MVERVRSVSVPERTRAVAQKPPRPGHDSASLIVFGGATTAAPPAIHRMPGERISRFKSKSRSCSTPSAGGSSAWRSETYLGGEAGDRGTHHGAGGAPADTAV
jgi:hypothetical protein